MNFDFERQLLGQGYRYVIGCDEVGRGSLAGPVVAAAVVFDLGLFLNKKLPDVFYKVDDSKVLNPEKRNFIYSNIEKFFVSFGFGIVGHDLIDVHNIHQASLCAMRQSIGKSCGDFFVSREALVLVDGIHEIPKLRFGQQAVVDGDAKIFSIAAASVMAKVFRDRYMENMGVRFPDYNFGQHKGYGTKDHVTRILKYGISEVHRKSFCRRLVR